MENQYLKENMKMGREMEKEKNIMKMVNQNLKENIKMEKNGMEKVKNIMIMVY